MICEKCGKTFYKPLELYTGEWACPHCRKNLSLSSVKLNVNDSNDELFSLSEICYLRALKCAENTEEYASLLQKSLDFCKKSAHAGHPKALVRLGYFYELGYFSADGAEAFKKACEYYQAVWRGKITVNRTKSGGDDYREGGLSVKKIAAARYLNLLANAPREMKGNARYSYEYGLQEVKEAGLYEERGSAAISMLAPDKGARAAEILSLCFSKERAPLFGLIYMDAEEFKELAAQKEKLKNGSRGRLARFAQKIFIVMFSADSDEFKVIKTERDFGEITKGGYYLYFFNTNGGHRISGGKLGSVKQYLEKGDATGEFAKIAKLVVTLSKSGGQSDLIFSDDDILVYKSPAESVTHATGDLLNAVTKNLTGENNDD